MEPLVTILTTPSDIRCVFLTDQFDVVELEVHPSAGVGFGSVVGTADVAVIQIFFVPVIETVLAEEQPVNVLPTSLVGHMVAVIAPLLIINF